MTARTWTTGDPEPTDHPPLVDEQGVTWLWLDDGEGEHVWNRQKITRYADGGVVGGELVWDWAGLLADYGPMREATDDQATSVTLTLKPRP